MLSYLISILKAEVAKLNKSIELMGRNDSAWNTMRCN